jgi:hypothetical protein
MTDPRIIEPDTFDFLVDDESRIEPIVGLRINGLLGDSVIVPMNADTADQVGEMLKAHARMFRQQRTATPSHARMMRHPAKASTK